MRPWFEGISQLMSFPYTYLKYYRRLYIILKLLRSVELSTHTGSLPNCVVFNRQEPGQENVGYDQVLPQSLTMK
jgi:hypothetical protein